MILRIDIHTQEKDCWKWNVSATGGFSLKSAWEAIRHKGGSFEFQNRVSKSHLVPISLSQNGCLLVESYSDEVTD